MGGNDTNIVIFSHMYKAEQGKTGEWGRDRDH